MLWFIQHYLWTCRKHRTFRRNETEAFEFGYNVVNEDLARAVLGEIEGIERPVVDGPRLSPLHAAGADRRARPDAFMTHFVHHPVSQSDPGGCCHR